MDNLLMLKYVLFKNLRKKPSSTPKEQLIFLPQMLIVIHMYFVRIYPHKTVKSI